MEQYLNQLGQPIGPPLPGWSKRPLPPRSPLLGRFCQVEPLDPERHAADLFGANNEDAEGRNWTYLPDDQGPYRSLDLYSRCAQTAASNDDPLWHAIIDGQSGRAVGVAAYARIDQTSGVIEVGGINYSPRLQRRPAATEAMYLMMRRVFDELGYRRYEWKCDSLNAPSPAAALRLGFRYEGLIRQAVVYKGRSRDTAWFSVVDSEWPALRRGFERWLDPANFDGEGRQRASLVSLRNATQRTHDAHLLTRSPEAPGA
jgi:RimJ/RimL family protein N-acetyltransferase